MRIFLLIASFVFFASIYATEYPQGQLPIGVTPLAYELHLSINPKLSSFSGQVSIKLRLDAETKEFWMHGQELNIQKSELEIGDEIIPVTYKQVSPEGVTSIALPRSVKAGIATLKITYTSPYSNGLSGLYKVTQNKRSYVYSQFEAISARNCFPSFDEPRFKTPFTISLTVPPGDVAISNNPVRLERRNSNRTKTLYFETTPPLPTYLVAFAVGPFDVVDGGLINGKIPFRGITTKGMGSKIRYALKETPKFVSILEDYFGIPYPYAKLDIIAVPDFAAGAMENAGAITFRDSLLLMNPKTAPVHQIRRFAEVTAHELAHQWFGNLVTLAWWDDIWLNEAFATWMANKVVMQYNPSYHSDLEELESTIYAMDADSLSSSRRIQEPIRSHHDIYNAFDSITYIKGAAVIDMFENYISPAVFQKGVQKYLHRFANYNATTHDFISELSTASGQDLSPSFKSFLTQPGVPLIQLENGRYSQVRYLPFASKLLADKQWQIPFCPQHKPCEILRDKQGALSDFGFPMKNAKGYYRFSGDYVFDAEHSTDLDKIVQIANLKASFRSGLLNTSVLLPQLVSFSQSPVRQIATAPISTLKWLDYYVVPSELKPQFQAYAEKIYAKAPAMSDASEQKLFDAELLDFKANVVKNPKIRRQLVQKALSYLRNNNSIDSNQVRLSLSVLVQEKPVYFSKLLKLFSKSQDSVQRSAILAGLAESDHALDLLLSQELRKNEILLLLNEYMSIKEHHEKGFDWLQKNLSALLKVLPQKGSGSLPWATVSFCSQKEADKVNALFSPVIDKLPGGPRSLQGVLERIHLCAALVDRQRDDTLWFFN